MGERFPTLSCEPHRGLVPTDPLLGAEPEVGRGHGPVGVIGWNDPRHESETASMEEPDDSLVGRLGAAALYPCDRRLCRSDPLGELSLRQAGTAPRFPDQFRGCHGASIALSRWRA